MQKNFQDNKNNIPSENETKEEYIEKHEQCTKIYALMQKPNYFFKEYEEFYKQIEFLKNSGKKYYLISKEWHNKFVDFCNSNELFYEYSYPSQIDNRNIILQDNSALKIEDNTNLYINNNMGFYNISFIIEEVWIKLKELFGGGPEYKILFSPDKNLINIVTSVVRINLLFIKNNIKNIEENDNINDYIHTEYIYLDYIENVVYLKKYINRILQTYKSNFFSSINDENNIENIQENIHYRLWLYSTYYGTPEVISQFIKARIIFLKQQNQLLDKNNLIDWKQFGYINIYLFQMILLSFFEKNLIKDIFPNRYTKFFDYVREFGNLKNEEEHSFPFFTIIIEEAPFNFMTEDTIYRLGKCEKCSCSQITYNACECKNCFFCLKNCEDIYRERRNYHFIKCKVHIISIFSNENKNYYLKNDNKSQFPLKGLVNLGNTCYMNSTLQCLRSIKELTDYFLDYFDENQINKNNLMGTGGILALAYANYIFRMNNSEEKILELSNFKYAIGIVDDRFSGFDQQDTHEFLSFLIDSIHEDLNRVIIKPILYRKSSDWEKNYDSSLILDKLKSKIEWNNFLKRNQSIMVDLFYGLYKTSIICPKCQHNSTNFSIFLSLQLPIPLSDKFFTIKVYFYEEWLSPKYYLYFEIILSKNNNKVLVAKKIIGKILGISPYQIEIYRNMKNEINKVFNNEEELPENITMIRAVKINLETLQDTESFFPSNKINYNNIEKKVENRIDEYFSYVRNINNSNNNSDDECDIIIDINGENEENFTKINYKKHSLQKFIIKHYAFCEEKRGISNSVLHKDYLIYTKTDQSCYGLYFQIFFAYFQIIMEKQLNLNNGMDWEELNKHRDAIKSYFDKLFKKYLEEENDYMDYIFNAHPELPFYLKLKVYKSKTSKFIPNSKKRKFNNFLNYQIDKEIKNNEMKNKISEELKEEQPFVTIEINKNQQNENGKISLGEKSKVKNLNSIYNNDCSNSEQVSSINLGVANSSTSKGDIISKEKDIKNSYLNNAVHSILIIFNPKYLIKDDDDDYSLANTSLQKIDLSPLFKTANQNIGKISINQCFEEFTKLQTLDENNLYNCPKCKENIAAKNKIELFKIPKILIIQLKRFENGQKIKTFIDFPIKNLDISQFISQSSPYPSTKYDLFAVSNHYGELEYGHYDATCLNYIDNNWYNFNDRRVEIIGSNNPDAIVTKDAYVLFYRQRKMENKNWDYIYKKKFKDIKDDNYLDKEYQNKIGNDLKNRFSIKSSVIELDEEEDEKIEEDSLPEEEISLDGFVYNPFRATYLKLKRRRLKRK